MNDLATDKQAIREIVDQWVIYSDAGDWERFAALWHDDGWMSATWFQATAKEFVDGRRKGWEKGVSIIHFLGAHTADIVGDRDRTDQDDDQSASSGARCALRRGLHRSVL